MSSPSGSAKRGSGPTHVRYGHARRPTAIDVKCTRCGGLARASQPASTRAAVVVDVSEAWQERYRLRCTACPCGADDVPWERVSAQDNLYFRCVVAGVELWGWNREHIGLVLRVLEGEPVESHPLAALATYLPKAWLLKTRRRSFANAARRMLSSR